MITITLTDEEQDFILGIAGRGTPGQLIIPLTAQSIAKKILRTRAAEEAFRAAYEQPETTECGLCGIPKDIHPDLTADHHWQWLRKPAESAKEQETRRLYPDEFPGEPAG